MASKSYLNLLGRVIPKGENGFLGFAPSVVIPSRTTFILKRRIPVALVKKGEEDHYRKLKAKNYIYDLVENTETKKQRNVKVVLTAYIEGLGEKGDVVEMKKNAAYHTLLLPGLGSYATDEDIRRAQERGNNTDDKMFSSKTAPLVVKFLERMVLGIVMNKETQWTLEPWHVKVAFRKAGVNVPEAAIKLPLHPITGPDMDVEYKEFIVYVTVNRREVARVRSRIHHWSTNIQDRVPYVSRPWCEAGPALYEDETSVLQQLSPQQSTPAAASPT